MQKVLRRICAVAVSLSLGFLVSGCSPSGPITVGIEKNNMPLSGLNSDEEIDGYVVEMSREAARRMGREVNFKFVDFKKGEQNFSSEGVDALFGRLKVTDKNKDTMYFTRNYFKESQILLVENGSVIEKADDLKDKKVGAVKGSEAETEFNSSKYASIVNSAKATQFVEPVTAKMTLDDSSIDAMAVSESYARNIMTDHAEQYRILKEKLSTEYYAVAVRRNDSKLHDEFESALNSMIDDGTAKNISVKWFGIDMTAYNN